MLLPPIPGPKSRQLYERERELIALASRASRSGRRSVFTHGQDCALYDLDGNTVLDFMAGIGVCSIGHAIPRTSPPSPSKQHV
jgi:4-aminobutyrate aminotransferase-like enzyme